MEKKYGCVTIKSVYEKRDVTMGTIYSALIGMCDHAYFLDDAYESNVLSKGQYEILSDDRCEFYPTQQVEVSDDGKEWRKAEFRYIVPEALSPYRVLVRGFGHVTAWGYCRPIEQPKQTELTLQEIAEKFDIPVSQLRIKDK